MSVIGLVEKITRDRDDLKKELNELIRKARSFQISAKSANVSEDIEKLQEKFDSVDRKRNNFEKELRKLSSYLK